MANRVEEAVTNLGPKLLRPPGALDELEFLTKCTRCDKCMRACPENAILKAGPSAGLGLNTPYLDPRSIPCFLCTTLPCIAECDDEALVWPQLVRADGTVLEGPRAVRMGTARVKPGLCVTWGDLDREPRACRVCVDRCPYPGGGDPDHGAPGGRDRGPSGGGCGCLHGLRTVRLRLSRRTGRPSSWSRGGAEGRRDSRGRTPPRRWVPFTVGGLDRRTPHCPMLAR